MVNHYVNGIYRGRMRVLLAILVTVLAGLVLRTAYIQLVRGAYLGELADELHNRERTLEAVRGDILDRNGTVLATSGSICRVSVVHNQIEDEENTARILSEVLKLDYEKVLQKVQKKVTRRTAVAAAALYWLPSRLRPEISMIWPAQALFSEINRGLAPFSRIGSLQP